MNTQFAIGHIQLTRVVESEAALLSPTEIYPSLSEADLDANMHWLSPRFYDRACSLLFITIQSFLVQADGQTMVVDTCVGDCKERRRGAFDAQRWNWLESLRNCGVEPKDVDIVLCTHFHTDHVGWNTRLHDGKWVPTFPNARYLFVHPEWDYWRSEAATYQRERAGDYVGDSLLPIVEARLADFVDMDHVISTSVKLLPAPGHTPGHVCVLLNSQGEEALLASDLVHTPLQVCYPDLSTRFCIDPDGARVTRRRFLERYADSGCLFVPAHFPSPSAGYIERSGNGYRFRYFGESPLYPPRPISA